MNAATANHPFAIVTRRNLWFGVSLLVILSGFVAMGINKSRTGSALNYGIDFTGGAAYTFKFAQLPGGTDSAANSKIIREAVAGAKWGNGQSVVDPLVQVFTDGGVSITTATGSDRNRQQTAQADKQAEQQALLTALQGKFKDVELVGSELVGPVVGEHLRRMALWALFWGCLGVTIYIWARYNIKGIGAGHLFGLSAIIAMIHDVLVMVAVYAWFRVEVNTNFVAAVLTVVGYSINDTVIIFDRIRENLGKLDPTQRKTFSVVETQLETSLWQVMGRSVVTVVCTLLPLATLFLFGGVNIRNFAFSLLVGVISGGYSSIFTAAPLFSLGYQRFLRKQVASGQMAPQRAVPAARPRPTTPAAGPKPATTAAPSSPGTEVASEPKTAAPAVGKTAASSQQKRKRRH
ncbi:MAG: protein translocase subunit SecF [Fimbriimonadaceae bacterium]|nr:protein translocase subunit SecF [Fimbriimonadaceae bacterium]